MSDVEIRALTPDEWRTWRRLRLTALADAPEAFGSRLADWQDAGEERWRARLGIPDSYNVVAVLDGRPVGMAGGVQGAEDGVAELISIWVGAEARGRRVADRLIGAVEEWARRSGARVLKLAVTPDNGPAQALYLRNGFADTGELGDLMPDGVRRKRVMTKPLGTP